MFALIAALAAVIAIGACGSDDSGGSGSADSGGRDPWKVGIPLALTGDLAVYAPTFENGFELAAKELNESSPPAGRDIELVIADTGDTDKGAVQVYQKLIRRDGVVAILGPITSSQGFAADPIADRAGVPVIAAANTAEGIPEIGECVFRVGAGETTIIPGAVKAATEQLGFKKAAVVYDVTDDYNATGGKAFEESLAENGVEIVGSSQFSSGQADFRTLLQPLLADNPDVLAVAASAADAIQIVRQARELGFEGPILGNKGFSGDAVTGKLGKTAGTIVIGGQYVVGADTPLGDAFAKAYEAEFGSEPDEFAALAYDAVLMLAEALEAAGPDAEPREVCEQLQQIQSLEGASGELSFTDVGDVEVEGVVLISRNGGPFKALNAQ